MVFQLHKCIVKPAGAYRSNLKYTFDSDENGVAALQRFACLIWRNSIVRHVRFLDMTSSQHLPWWNAQAGTTSGNTSKGWIANMKDEEDVLPMNGRRSFATESSNAFTNLGRLSTIPCMAM